MVIAKPRSGLYTVADIDALPEGVRAELFDGQLVMNAAPNRRHQRAVLRLSHLLSEVVSEELEVVVAPFDWQITDTLMFEPDLLVLPFVNQEVRFIGTPLLVAEVLSPSTRVIDLTAKRRYYEEAGVPIYLIVDPDEPSVTVYEMQQGRLVETNRAEESEAVTLPAPFRVDVAAAALV